jgi:DNA-binding PadR family transcriptional regulator
VTEERTEKRSKKRYVITEKGLNVISYLRGAEALINI